MCKDMVRKDFEILRIQDALYNIFSNTEFYSKYDDELLSVQHSVELASGYIISKKEINPFYNVVSEAATALAFSPKETMSNCLESILKKTNILIEIIFNSSEQESEVDAQREFINAFKKNFPKIQNSYLERRSIELNDGIY